MGSILTVLFVIALITMGGFSKVRKAIKEFDESAKDLAAPQQNHHADKKDQQQSDYFTYESPEPDSSRSFKKPMQPSVVTPVMNEDSLNLEPVSFDLRQAVIYQTILQNDYIADLK